MAALSITVGNVSFNSGTVRTLNAGLTITAGQAVYEDANSAWQLSDADGQATAVCDGIALHGSLTGQPLRVLKEGTMNLGATLAVGIPYFIHTTAGGIGVIGELSSGDYTTFIGIATATNNLELKIYISGAVQA